MEITFVQLIVWLVVGALAGSFTGLVVKRAREGFGRWTNLGVGLMGALIGGLLFKVFNIDLGLDELTVSFEDLLAAFLGSLIFVAMVWWIGKRLKDKP